MAKFTIQYVVEALTMNDALSTAYEVAYLSNTDFDSVTVEPTKPDTIDVTFGDTTVYGEVNPSVYEHVYRPRNDTDFTD